MKLGYLAIVLALILIAVSGVTAARNWNKSKTVRNTQLAFIVVGLIMLGFGIYDSLVVPPVNLKVR